MSTSTARELPSSITDTSIPATLALEHGYRPNWLLTPYSAALWIIKDTGSKPNLSINFDVTLPNGDRLTNYPHLIDSIKRTVYSARTGPMADISSGGAQMQIALNLIILARWMISNNISKFSELNYVDIEEFSGLAVRGTHNILNTEGVLNQYLEKITSIANFDERDADAERLKKAMAVLPYRKHNHANSYYLHREKVLKDAGLEGVGVTGRNCVIPLILDEFSLLCRFKNTGNSAARLSSKSLDELDDEVITEEQLRRLLMTFDYLYRFRRYLDDTIQIPPFPGSSPRREARKYGKEARRTATIPIAQAITLIERSVRWVLDYAPIILRFKDLGDSLFDEDGFSPNDWLDDELRLAAWPENAPAGPFPIVPGRYAKSPNDEADEIGPAAALGKGMTLPVAIKFLLTAGAIVIAAFSARRAAEIVGLKAGCIERDDLGRPWLRAFIHKTDQEDSLVPVPDVVAATVEVLEKLSAKARALTGTPYLFQFNLPGSDICQGLSQHGLPIFRLNTHLRHFGYFVDVPHLSDGTRWTFRAHQFRRFFAILYIWVYELGDWGALSYHLRHWNREMTRRYTSDEELGHVISMADREHTARILMHATLGAARVSGHEGERLKAAAQRLYDRMSQHIQVVPERKFAQRIMRLVERSGVSLEALPWGYCAKRKSAEPGECKCAPDASAPDTSAATFSTCNACHLSVRSGTFLPYVKGSRQLHQKVAHASDVPAILRRASETFCRELDEYIASVTPNQAATEAAS